MIELVRGPINGNLLSFKPDRSKEAQEVIFSWNMNKVYRPPLYVIEKITTEKHLGIQVDEEFTFKHHINNKKNTANKGIGIIPKLNNSISRPAL